VFTKNNSAVKIYFEKKRGLLTFVEKCFIV